MRHKEKSLNKSIRSEEVEKDGSRYKYELFMREGTSVASYKLPLYSISIKMECENGEVTFAESEELFSDGVRAKAFFERLVKNLATPIDLPYIIEDELAKP